MAECNSTCSSKISELLEVNAAWKRDYANLVKETEKLKTEFAKLKQVRNTGKIEGHDQKEPSCSVRFVDCKIQNLEAYQPEQVGFSISYKTEYELEKMARIRVEERENKLKEKLKDSKEVIQQFQRRTLSLENELKAKHQRLSYIDEEERAKNIKLMKSQVFPPRDDRDLYPDERDSSSSSSTNQMKNIYNKQEKSASLYNKQNTKNKSKNKIFLYQ